MAQNQFEVEIKLGLDKSTQLLDREIQKIDKTLTDKIGQLNKQFDESIKGQNLTTQERFSRRSDFLQKNSSSTQSLQSQKEVLLGKKARISEMSSEISKIGNGTSQFDTIGKYLAERIDFIKQLDSWIGQYTKEITEFKPVIVAAEQQKAYQQKITNAKEKAAKTGKVDYKAETMAKRNLTEKQYNKEIDAMSKYYETNARTNQVEEDKIARQKEARFTEEMKKIVAQQKKSKMSDAEFEKRRPQIEKDVRAYVDKTHAGGVKSLAGSDKWGRKLEVRGFQEGFEKNSDGRYVDAKGRFVKGTDTSVLRTSAFSPFINQEGDYVSATNSEGQLKKSIRVYDPRLANIENVGRVGDLRNQTYTGIENAYSSLLNQLKVLESGGKQGTEDYQKISQLISLIPEIVKDAYSNTSSKEIKTAFEESLTAMKAYGTNLEAEESPIGGTLHKNSELSGVLREQLKLKGKVSQIQPWEVGELPEAPTPPKTDRTDEKQIKRDQISDKQQKVIDQKHKDELWHSIEGAKESTYNDKGELLQQGIKDFLAGLSGDKEQLHNAVLALTEQIVQTAGVDIDAKQQMSEVISQQSINVPIKYRGEERDATLESAIPEQDNDAIDAARSKYQAVLEEQRSKMAGRLSEGFQRVQSALAFQQTGKAGDEAVKQAIERINWLADIVVEIGQPKLGESLRKIAQGNPRFKGMDANTVANSISKIYAFPEGMDASLSHNLNNLNQARQAQGLKPIKEEKYREKFFKENPEIAQKYEESKAARERYDSVESDKVSDKLQAFFSVVGQTEEGVNKFITVLAKAYEHMNGTISKVVKDNEGDRRVTAPAKKWVEDTVEYRVSSSGNVSNPNAGVNAPYYEKQGIKGQEVNWEEVAGGKPSPALTTNLQFKAGLTGNIYGGNSPQENAEIAKSILEKKKKELERVKALVANPKSEASKNKNLKRIQEIQAEIDFHYKNWDELVMAQTPVVRKGKKNAGKDDFEAPVAAPVNPEVERIKNLKESVKQSGFSQGASFTAKNSVRRTFGGTITGIKGEGSRQVVEALLEDGKTVKYTFDSLLKQLVTYSKQAATTVGNTSEQIKADIIQDSKQIEQTTKSTIESKALKSTPTMANETSQTGKALQQEKTAITDVNTTLDKHETEVLSAAGAERQKILVSQDLAKQLAKEGAALDEVGKSAKKAEIQKGVTYTYKDLQSYDDATHTYTDTNGNKLRSITQLSGALKGFTPSATAIADEKAFMAAIANTPTGEQLTAEKIGMTAQDFAKKKNAVISREKGNLEHEVFDLLSKTGFSGVKGFAGKDVEVKGNGATEVVDAQEQFARVLKEKAGLLSKLGIDNAEKLLLQAVESYTKAINNAHIQLTPFSETPMAASFSGPKGTFDYSFTPDQVARSSDGSPQNFILDTKTGKTYGTESFQLAGQLYGVLANAQNPKFQKMYQESGIDTNKDFSLFIANVKDGFTQLIQHMALTEKEFYDLLARANDIIDGNAEPLTKDEQATLMNREMATGRIFGRSETSASEKASNNNFVSYAPNENGSIDKREQAIIGSYLTEYQKLINYQTQLNNLKKQQEELAQKGVGYTSEESQKLEQQISTMQSTVNLQKKIMAEKNLDYKVLNTPREADKIAIGNVLLSDKGSQLVSLKQGKINTLGNNKQSKNDTNITTTRNTEATKDLDLLLNQYKELLSLQNQLKESNIKAESLTGDKQTAQQNASANLQKRIDELRKISNLTGEITDKKRIEGEITRATYLTESERAKKLNTFRTIVGEAQQKSLDIDTKYAQAPKDNNLALSNMLAGYYKNLEQQGKIDKEIARAQQKGLSLTGTASIENKSFINSLQAQKTSLANQFAYDKEKKTLNGVQLTEEQINKLEAERTRILKTNQLEMEKVGVSANKARGFFTQLKDSFKQSFSQMSNQLMQIFSFYQIRQVFMRYISSVEQLDQRMVDLQIASGYTKKQIASMMTDFNELAEEIGKTTQEVAAAANDWLRAGYSGKQAAELTEASMQLSTLGMIESSEATSYLVSVLKGWKLEASEVQGVVDKLTAVDMAAAISAGDLAEAMSRASNSAQMAGSTLDRYIAYLTTITDVTQKSAASVGESMKTVYSRYQNIAAGKFEAAQADIENENYNAEDWANLNDVERALGALGIEIRSSVDNFREFDDVAEEIASKWKTYTDVQKSGIATALAGTRQRENVLTLFENWDSVKKFEEISANAYGTAIKKMESYTNSVEAAKNRISVALDKWVLALNQSVVLGAFYNTVASVADNLAAWGAAILLATAATNLVGLSTSFQTIWNKLMVSLSSLATNMQAANTRFFGYFGSGLHDKFNLSGYNNYNVSRGAGRRTLRQTLKQNFVDSFLIAQKENYAKSLTNAIAGMDELTIAHKDLLKNGLIPVQNVMLSYENSVKQQVASIMLDKSLDEKLAASKLEQILYGQNREWVDNMLATMDQQELNLRREQLKNARLTEQADIDLRIATEQLAKMRKSAAGQTLGGNLGGSTQSTPTGAAAAGAMTLLNGGMGTWGGYAFGNYTLDNQSVAPLLSMLMGTVGSVSGASIGSLIGNGGIKALFSGALGSVLPMIGIIATAATAIAGFCSWMKKKKLEEAQSAFKTAAENYQEAVSVNVTAKKYDELSSGVDSFGRNVSLSDEDYEKFLEYSNALSEVFPQLTIRTDESGNAIFYMGNALGGATEKVEELTDALETLANYRMVMGEGGELVLGAALDDAANTYKKAQKDKNEAEEKNKNIDEKIAEEKVKIKSYETKLGNIDDDLDKAERAYEIATALSNGAATEEELIKATSKETVAQFYEDRGYSQFSDITFWDSNVGITKTKLDNLKQQKRNARHQSEADRENWKIQIGVSKGRIAELGQSKEQADAADNEMIAAREEISEYGIAYAKILRAYQGTNEVQQLILDSAIRQVDGAKKKKGKWEKLSPEEYKSNIARVVEAAQKLTSNKQATTLVEAASEKTTNGLTVEEATKARNQLLDYLKSEFPNIEKDGDMLKVVVGLGFEVVDGEIVDKENILNKFKDEFGIVESNGDKISLENLKQLKVEDAKQIYRWLKDGTLEVTDDMMLAVKLLKSSMALPKEDWEAMEKFMTEKTQDYGALEEKMSQFFTSGNYKEGRVSEAFSEYDEQTRKAIEQIQDNLNNNVYALDSEEYNEAVKDVCLQGLSTIMSYQDQYAEAWKDLYYPDNMEVDGYVNTFEELQTALKETAKCYEELSDAQKEQAKAGKLSLATVLELLTSNANYINLLEFEKETLIDSNGTEYEHIKAIKLKKGAEEEMAGAQLLALKASALQTIQTLYNTKAEALARAECIRRILAERGVTVANYAAADSEYANAQAKNDVAKETKQATETLAPYIGMLAGLVNIMDYLISGKHEVGGVRKAYTEAKNAIVESIETLGSSITDYETKRNQNSKDAESWLSIYQQYSNQELMNELKSIEGQEGPNGRINGELDITDKQIDVWKYFYQNVNLDDVGDWLKTEGFSKASDGAKDSILELLQALDSLIDKEWEAMKVFDENTLTPTGYTQYFEKKRASLERLAAYYEGVMQNTNLTEKERLDAEKNYIENQKAINNLDDEEIEDKYKILELYGASINSLISMKQQLVKTSDTYEELLENQKNLNSLLQDEIDLRKSVSEWQQKLSDRELNYVKGSAWSNNSAYDAAMNASLAEIDKQIEAIKASIQFNFSQAVYGYMTEGMSEMEARAYVAFGNSDYSKAYREAQQGYLDLIDSKTEYVVNRTSAQIEELSNKLQLLEDSKPQEWIRISDIESYYTNRSTLLQNQVSVYQKALEDVSDLTDEQIKNLVDGLNEATVALHEAKINALEDKTELQEKQYDAIVYRINLYKDELQDAIDAIEKAYEDEIKPLEDANKERERAIELENLLLAKKNQEREKERVYRKRIGWVKCTPMMDYIG